MNDTRPDPDVLLSRVESELAKEHRGQLRIFFGYAAGVGKTYAMLQEAQRRKAAGVDVVVGYVEPHGRKETEALLTGLEALPLREVVYRDLKLREFDLDAALNRKPQLILVDELAHTNAEGMRHAKRWQDVEELLAAGIDVYTTVNVQHIESLNDVIGQVTGVVVRETIPDQVFASANELELVDISPEELLARLHAGKVYIPEQAQRALQSFFQKSNLSALRELSFRQAAQRIHSDVESARRQKGVPQPWATAERLLVCVGPSPTTARVLRTAKRMATALDAPFMGVAVDSGLQTVSNRTKEQIAENFRLAERLGAETVTLTGQDVAGTILDYARSRNVTKILIGKTNQPRWRRLLFANVVDQLLENSGEIDVYVIHGEKEVSKDVASPRPAKPFDWRPYLASAGIIAATAALAAAMKQLRLAEVEANIVMVFLAAIAFIAYRFGRGPAVLASITGVLVFDFFFVRPFLDFAVSDAQYLVTFLVMLAIGLGISTLTSRLKGQVDSTRLRERRTTALYQLGKQLSSLYGRIFLIAAAAQKVAEIFDAEVAVYLRRQAGPPLIEFGQETAIGRHPVSVAVADWVIQHEQIAGPGTNTLPNAAGLFLPLTGSQQSIGAIAIRVPEMERLLEPDQRQFLEACASQLALALERDQLAIAASEARVQAEAEQVRSSLLSSVSHDLKTPLAAIAGASSSLLESSLDETTRRQLLETVADESLRLNRLLENILQMSRLDAGAATPNKQWHVLEEIVGSALNRTGKELEHHPVSISLAGDLPLVSVDGLLVEQVFVNLLENAARYTPRGTSIEITAAADDEWLQIAIADRGPGLPHGLEERIFEKFFRASPTADAGRGSGLGLAICRAIVKAHGGKLTAANRPGGGAVFMMRLPVAKNPPQVVVE